MFLVDRGRKVFSILTSIVLGRIECLKKNSF